MREELSTHAWLEGEVDVGVVLEGRVQAADHGVVEHLHDLDLVQQVLLQARLHDALLGLLIKGMHFVRSGFT